MRSVFGLHEEAVGVPADGTRQKARHDFWYLSGDQVAVEPQRLNGAMRVLGVRGEHGLAQQIGLTRQRYGHQRGEHMLLKIPANLARVRRLWRWAIRGDVAAQKPRRRTS